MTAQEESFPWPPACLKSVGFEDKTASEGIPVGYSDLINGKTFRFGICECKNSK